MDIKTAQDIIENWTVGLRDAEKADYKRLLRGLAHAINSLDPNRVAMSIEAMIDHKLAVRDIELRRLKSELEEIRSMDGPYED